MERCGICVSRQQGKVPISGRRSENMKPLKKWDKLVKRNSNGQFERGSKALAGAGRPKGSLNKTTTQLKEAILGALEAAGGKEGSVGYLRRLAIENSSAFASLLGKVLPTTLAADESSGGVPVKMVFERHIVWPDGRREIEGVTPKALPSPSPVSVESNDQSICVEKPSQNSASDHQ
jgi:hypothetical protein